MNEAVFSEMSRWPNKLHGLTPDRRVLYTVGAIWTPDIKMKHSLSSVKFIASRFEQRFARKGKDTAAPVHN
jgi:hypothetical protein